jgi:hypothetical protein
MQLSSVFGVIWLVADACPPCPVMIRNIPPCSRWSGCSFFTRPYRRLASARAPAVRSQEQPLADERISALPPSPLELRAGCVATGRVRERCQALRDRHGPGFVSPGVHSAKRTEPFADPSRPETPAAAPGHPEHRSNASAPTAHSAGCRWTDRRSSRQRRLRDIR